MVNNPVQSLNLQAQAVAGSEGAASVNALVREIETAEPKKEVKEVELMQQLLEAGSKKDLTTQILKDLMTKVANAGIIFESPKAQSKVEGRSRELDRQKVESDEFGDKVELNTNRGEDNSTLPVKGVDHKTVRHQSSAAIEQEWAEIKEKLIKEGKSAEEISRLELQFKTGEARNRLLEALKDSALMYYLDSDSRVRKMIRQRGFADLLEKAGKELGKEAAVQAQSEVKNFVMHELENQLILRTFLQDDNFEDCHRLIRVGEKVGLKSDEAIEWMTNVWPQKKEHYGLNLLDVPHQVAGFVDVKDHDPNARKERGKYDYKDEDEKDLMLNRLRALYLQMVLRPGAINHLSTWFKVRKLKNGLVRLGVYTKDMDEQTQEEAKTLAKMKVMEMLEEALHERATFFDEGPAKNLVENKIKNCLKNLDRLGFELKDKDFTALRDKANHQMHELVQRELEVTSNKRGPKAEKKVKLLQKLIARLQKEA